MADDPASIMVIIFGMPVAIVGITQYFKYKTNQLRGRQADPKQLEKDPANRFNDAAELKKALLS